MEPKFVCDGKNAQGNLVSKFSDYISMPSEPTNREKWDELLESVGCLAAIVDHPVDARAHVTVQQNVDNLSFAKAALEKIHLDYARWLDRTSLKILGALPCPGEPEADFIFVGDSSMALVQAEAPPEGSFEPPRLTRRNIGEFIKADPSGLRETAASVQYGMRWGKGLEQINDEIESCLNNVRRRSRERRAPAVIVVSYAGNDVWGKHGFVGNTWIDSRSVHRNPAVQRAASEWQDELARKHFAQLDRLANFLQRPDVGAISIIAYADANSFGLHQDFARQMCLFGDAAQNKGLLAVTGSPLTRATTRYDGFHAEDSESNRAAYYRYFVAMARLTYQMWRLKDCEALRKQARLQPVMTPKEEKARAEAEARDRYRASYVFLEPHDRFPENKIMIEPNLCKTCVYPDGHEVALLDEITGEHLKATPEELERAGIIVPQGTGEPTVDITSSPEKDSSVNDPVEDDFVPDYDPDDEPHPTQKTTLLAEPNDSCPDEKLMSVNAGKKSAWEHVSTVEIEESDLRVRSDIDQPPETVDEIIEIVGDHYKTALAEGYQDPQDDALESDDEEIVFNQQIVGGSSALESVAEKMKFNKIYAAQYLEGGALHLSRNPHGAISTSSNALRHYTEAVTGRTLPLHFIDDDGDDDELPPPPPPAEPCPYKRDKDGVHRPVAEELPALKRKTAVDLGAAPKAKAAPDSLKKLRTGDKVVNVDMSSSAEAGAKKGSSEVVDVEMEETAGTSSSSANPPKAKHMPKPSSVTKAAASSSAAPGRDAPKLVPAGGTPIRTTMPANQVPGAAVIGWYDQEQFFVSKRVSGLLRGHNHANRRDRIPLPDFQDGAWMDFASVFSFIKRRYSRSLTVSDLIDIVTSNHRFMLDVQLAREGELFADKYLFLPVRIKAIQSHNDWILENINMAWPEVDRIICLDPSFTIERLLRREHPTLPVRLDLHLKDIHPKILYHYTHIAFLDDLIRCGICPGGLRTSKAHSYFSAFDPWSIQKTSQAGMASTRPVAVAVDVEMAVAYGIRFAVTQSQAVVTTDWVPNQFLIYAYDVSAKCFIYANHDYAKERASFNQDLRDIVARRRERLDRGDEADDNARRQSLLARSRWDLFGKYEKWVRGAWVENAFILESYNREFCKDQLEHADANIGTYLRTWRLHGSRKAMPPTTQHGLSRWDQLIGRIGPLRWRCAMILEETKSSSLHGGSPFVNTMLSHSAAWTVDPIPHSDVCRA